MLINIDLSGADWVTTAYLSRDPAMLDVVKSGRSPHQVTGSRICGIPEDLVVKEDKIVKLIRDSEVIADLRKTHFPELATATFLPRTMSIRQMSKKANHGLNFREGYRVFALLYELEERESKNIVNRYTCQCSYRDRHHDCKPAYPLIRDWWDRTDEQIRKTRRLTNCFGRTVYFMGQIGNDLFKQAYSFIPQSTTGDCCEHGRRAMMEDGSLDFRPAQPLAQVHDSLLTQYLSRDFAAMARYCVKLGREYMRPVCDYGEPYRLGTDLKIGFDWANMLEIKLTDDAGVLAPLLAEAYEKLCVAKAAKKSKKNIVEAT
jgi:hypothetical protein